MTTIIWAQVALCILQAVSCAAKLKYQKAIVGRARAKSKAARAWSAHC